MKTTPLALTAVLALPILGLMPACNTTGSQAATARPTITSAETLEGQLDRTDAEVVSSLAALERLRADEIDKSAAYQQYAERVEAMKADQQSFDDSAASLKEESMAYQEAWRADAQQLQDTELRRTAQDRLRKLEDSMVEVNDQHRTTSRQLQSYVTELTGIQTYLKNDMTPAGVEAISAQFDDAKSKGETVRSSLDAMGEQLLEVTNTLDDESRDANMLR